LAFNTFRKGNELNVEYRKREILQVKASNNVWKAKKDMNVLSQTLIPDTSHRLLYNDYHAFFFEICSNPIYFERLLYYKLASAKSLERAKSSVIEFSAETKNGKQTFTFITRI
jgi:hypothetical protein